MKDLLIGGEWREPAAGGQREIRCPADGRLVATVAEAGRADTLAAQRIAPVDDQVAAHA